MRNWFFGPFIVEFEQYEAARNQWSVRELRRQIDSSLYERLALSRDKDEVRRLAAETEPNAADEDRVRG